MDACRCGASIRPGDEWCWLCFEPVGSPAPSPVPATVGGRAPAMAAQSPASLGLDLPPLSPVAPPPAPTDRSISLVVVGSIALGVALQAYMYAAIRNRGMEAGPAIRLALTLTILQYGLVAALVFGRAAVSRVQPRWVMGSPTVGLLMGAMCGAGAGALILAFVSALTGRLSSDPRILVLVSEGGWRREVAVGAIVVGFAPLVEEVLFRGLLAESLRARGRNSALAVSAFAFAAWHLMPSSLRYYMVVGFVLGLLYWRFGLAGSISAHTAFNGVLFLAVLTVVNGPPQALTAPGVRLQVPGGWTLVRPSSSPAVDLAAEGPSGAGLIVRHFDEQGAVPTADQLASDLASGHTLLPPRTVVDPASVRVTRYPAGPAVRIVLSESGHRADAVLLPAPGRLWTFVLLARGSPKAYSDFDGILRSVTLEGSAPSSNG